MEEANKQLLAAQSRRREADVEQEICRLLRVEPQGRMRSCQLFANLYKRMPQAKQWIVGKTRAFVERVPLLEWIENDNIM